MSVLTLQVDEVMRTLSNDGQYPFVENDKEVDIVRFALNTGFTDVVLDEHSALRVMYQRPGETEVRAQTLTYHDTDGLHNYYDWHLLSADLEHKGTIACALCILRTDGDVEEWHTTPYQIRVLNTIHTDDSDEGDESITPTVVQRVAVLESVMHSVAGGAPVVVDSASAMTDTDRIYVLTTDSKWYYYDGTEWASGGTYGAAATDATLTQAGMPADAKAAGDKTNALKSTVDALSITVNGSDGQSIDKTGEASWTDGLSIAGNTGSIITLSNYSYAQYSIPDGVTSISGYTRAGNDISQGMAFYTSNGTYISGDNHYPSSTGYDWTYSFEVPENAGIVRISCATSRKSQFTCSFTYGTSGGLVNDVIDLKDKVANLIDDTAGAGVTTKTWSANKIRNISIDVNSLGLTINSLDSVINGSEGETVDVTTQGTWIDGHGISGDTGAINAEGGSYKEYQLGDAVLVSGYTRGGNDTARGMAFYTSDGTYISGDNHYPSSTGYNWNYSFDVPENAAIFRITCAKAYQDRFTCSFTYNTASGIVNRVEAIEEQLSDFQVEVSNPTDGQVLVYNATSGKWENGQGSSSSDVVGTVPEYYWLDKYFISKYHLSSRDREGTYVANANRSIAIADIHAFAGGRIAGHTRLADDALIAFYDHNDIYISSVALPSGASYDFDFDITVPDNAKIIKVSCGTPYKSTFSLKGYNLINGINNSVHVGALEYDPPEFVYGLDSDKSDFHYDSQTRLQDMYNWFDILASTFARNITKVKIGESTEPEGEYAVIDSSVYDINGYIIQGDNYIEGNDFIIASGIHGDESSGDGIQSVVSVAYFIRDMLFNPGKNKYLSFMKWNCKILVIPVMNPWGYQNGKRCNGRGVDCNRNFDLNWIDSTSYGYSAGTAAFSENESFSVATYISENFASAKYCTELHTRGGNILPDDDRWWTKVTASNTVMQNAVTDVGYYLRRIYGGIVANGTNAADEPTFRAYTDAVIGIPTNLTEFAKSCNSDIKTFNSDSVQIQYVQYLGSMTQKLVETYVM